MSHVSQSPLPPPAHSTLKKLSLKLYLFFQAQLTNIWHPANHLKAFGASSERDSAAARITKTMC